MTLRKITPTYAPAGSDDARQDAQHSTGTPRSAASKQNSKLNALNLDGMSPAVRTMVGEENIEFRCQAHS